MSLELICILRKIKIFVSGKWKGEMTMLYHIMRISCVLTACFTGIFTYEMTGWRGLFWSMLGFIIAYAFMDAAESLGKDR